MAPNSLFVLMCPLRNYILTHSLTHSLTLAVKHGTTVAIRAYMMSSVTMARIVAVLLNSKD